MKNKYGTRRRRRRVSKPGVILLSCLALGGVWFADAVYRAVDKPEKEEYSVEWQTEAQPGVAMTDAATEPQTSAEPEDTQEAADSRPVINEATTGLGITSDLPEGYMSVPQDETGLHSGILVQIDENHPYTGSTGELTSFQDKNESYRMKRMDLPTRQEVLEAMNSMASAYVSDNGAVNLMVYSTTAPYGVEGSLYPTALPDRSSGWCIDLCLLNEDETISKFTEPNAWLNSYSWRYGFVFSYPESDAAATGVAGAPYHLRYVGPVHAGLMHQENLTLTQYYDYLKNHPLDAPLYYTMGDVIYTVYYVPAVSGTTEVPVPLNKSYELSGNNTDGFIVTVKG